MTTPVYAGTSVKISLEVRTVATDALVDPTTLALIITPHNSSTPTVKAITDLTHVSTGFYTYVHRFPKATTPGVATITAFADAAVDASAILNESSLRIVAPIAAQASLP